MSCCGRGNPTPGSSYPASRPATVASGASARVRPISYSQVYFEYFGPTALTAVGRATGKHYRFDRPGARIPVDPSDEASVAQVPNLRVVLGP
jgi:hypothetical protein